ncbi:uncharacterized mitochondrial protein AtMg00310-like [Humulus lupulus]|uniref:uncharacterized mitochondrial protein AtMg00310-like n=1 Tax=Humulus lupulus TaxID=3486 RepID=UPI002B403A66|nr:uncharacterized mitochondrial protein AtMg00310-like [Humulus lupulus]
MEKINKDLRSFWWGDSEEKKTIHTVAWSKLCKLKRMGGLGFRMTEATNDAFMTKRCWELITGTKGLWHKQMKAKYIKGEHFLNCNAKNSDSHLWKTILKERETLAKGLCKRIGNGTMTFSKMDMVKRNDKVRSAR